MKILIISILILLTSYLLIEYYREKENYNCIAKKLTIQQKLKIDNYNNIFHKKYCLILINQETNQLYQVIVPRNTYQFSIVGESIVVLECNGAINYNFPSKIDNEIVNN